MGSGSSRLRSCPSPRDGPGNHRRRRPTIKRSISSVLICGASSSQSNGMEDDPAALLVNSAQHYHSAKLKLPRKYSALSLGSVAELSSRKTENGIPTGRPLIANENPGLDECSSSNADTSDKGKCLSESEELVPSDQSITGSGSHEKASTSYMNQPSPDSALANESPTTDASDGEKIIIDEISSQNVPELTNCCVPPPLSPEESSSDESSVEINVNERILFSFSDSGSGSAISASPRNVDSPNGDGPLARTPLGSAYRISEREETRQDTSVVHVDVPSVSDILPSSSAEISSREARRNSRRLFWDAFSRRSSRGHTDSRTFFFPSADPDNLRSHDRWLLDFGGDFFNDGVGGDFRSYERRTHRISERRRHARSEIWERLRGGLDAIDHRTAVCPRGIHSDGTCSCQPSLSSEESGARAGVSRIVMLAEALFEVLDEIHRQPMSVSLSMVSLPAPESVVDSFPVKTHRKPEKLASGEDNQQCYICLAEYEEGDNIRVLPCHHEYHLACVDKWLKEIHGVCPLCRGDVRECFTEGSVSNSETPSL